MPAGSEPSRMPTPGLASQSIPGAGGGARSPDPLLPKGDRCAGEFSCWDGQCGSVIREGEAMLLGPWLQPRPPQSQPLSFTMCDISMMNFPSLYFWLVSKACSYFHPRVVLQLSQKMSATE